MSLTIIDENIQRDKKITFLLIISLIILATIIIIGASSQLSISSQIVMNGIYQENTNIAYFVALSISGDDIALLRPGDENTETFKQLIEQIRSIQNIHPHVTFVYVCRLVDGEVTLVLASDNERNYLEESLIGEVYESPPSELYQAFNGHIIHTKDFYSDKWGTFISSFVPLYSSNGEIVGIVGVDIEKEIVDPYIEDLESDFVSTITSVLVLLLIATGSGVYVFVTSNKHYSKMNDAYLALLDAAEAANEGIFELDWSDNTFTFSSFISNALGKGRKESRIHIYDLYQQAFVEDQAQLLAEVDKTRYNPKYNKFESIWRFNVSEKIISLYLKGTVLCDPDTNKPMRVLGMGEDYTEFMRDKAALTQTTKFLRMFSSVLHIAIERVTREQMVLINRISGDDRVSGNARYFVDNILTSLNCVIALCTFARLYADIGYDEPKWISLKSAINGFSNHPAYSKVDVKCEINDVEIYADMMFANVLYNLFDNSIRHGKKVTSITVKTALDNDNLIISYEDDGVGLTEKEKETLFVRGIGKNTGVGMFLSREILSMTDIEIEEVGKPGSGALFLITVHPGYYKMME